VTLINPSHHLGYFDGIVFQKLCGQTFYSASVVVFFIFKNSKVMSLKLWSSIGERFDCILSADPARTKCLNFNCKWHLGPLAIVFVWKHRPIPVLLNNYTVVVSSYCAFEFTTNSAPSKFAVWNSSIRSLFTSQTFLMPSNSLPFVLSVTCLETEIILK